MIDIDLEQPFPSVNVILAVPALIPVTKPVLSTVAILVFEEDQLPDPLAVEEPVN